MIKPIETSNKDETSEIVPRDSGAERADQPPESPEEVGGPPGLEPTRYGDWEKNGRCIDF